MAAEGKGKAPSADEDLAAGAAGGKKDGGLPVPACHLCNQKLLPPHKKLRCSRCYCVYYCSKEHQKQDWKAHKKQVCTFMQKEYADRGAVTKAERLALADEYLQMMAEAKEKYREGALNPAELHHKLLGELREAEMGKLVFPRDMGLPFARPVDGGEEAGEDEDADRNAICAEERAAWQAIDHWRDCERSLRDQCAEIRELMGGCSWELCGMQAMKEDGFSSGPYRYDMARPSFIRLQLAVVFFTEAMEEANGLAAAVELCRASRGGTGTAGALSTDLVREIVRFSGAIDHGGAARNQAWRAKALLELKGAVEELAEANPIPAGDVAATLDFERMMLAGIGLARGELRRYLGGCALTSVAVRDGLQAALRDPTLVEARQTAAVALRAGDIGGDDIADKIEEELQMYQAMCAPGSLGGVGKLRCVEFSVANDGAEEEPREDGYLSGRVDRSLRHFAPESKFLPAYMLGWTLRSLNKDDVEAADRAFARRLEEHRATVFASIHRERAAMARQLAMRRPSAATSGQVTAKCAVVCSLVPMAHQHTEGPHQWCSIWISPRPTNAARALLHIVEADNTPKCGDALEFPPNGHATARATAVAKKELRDFVALLRTHAITPTVVILGQGLVERAEAWTREQLCGEGVRLKPSESTNASSNAMPPDARALHQQQNEAMLAMEAMMRGEAGPGGGGGPGCPVQ